MLYDYYHGKYFEELRVRGEKLGVARGDRLMIMESVKEGKEANIDRLFIEGGVDGKAIAIVNYQFNPTPNDTNLEPK